MSRMTRRAVALVAITAAAFLAWTGVAQSDCGAVGQECCAPGVGQLNTQGFGCVEGAVCDADGPPGFCRCSGFGLTEIAIDGTCVQSCGPKGEPCCGPLSFDLPCNGALDCIGGTCVASDQPCSLGNECCEDDGLGQCERSTGSVCDNEADQCVCPDGTTDGDDNQDCDCGWIGAQPCCACDDSTCTFDKCRVDGSECVSEAGVGGSGPIDICRCREGSRAFNGGPNGECRECGEFGTPCCDGGFCSQDIAGTACFAPASLRGADICFCEDGLGAVVDFSSDIPISCAPCGKAGGPCCGLPFPGTTFCTDENAECVTEGVNGTCTCKAGFEDSDNDGTCGGSTPPATCPPDQYYNPWRRVCNDCKASSQGCRQSFQCCDQATCKKVCVKRRNGRCIRTRKRCSN